MSKEQTQIRMAHFALSCCRLTKLISNAATLTFLHCPLSCCPPFQSIAASCGLALSAVAISALRSVCKKVCALTPHSIPVYIAFWFPGLTDICVDGLFIFNPSSHAQEAMPANCTGQDAPKLLAKTFSRQHNQCVELYAYPSLF